MNGERAQMVFTDPPYNVPIQGHVGGSGVIKHREFAMASGEMTSSEFTTFLRTTFQRLAEVSVNMYGLAPHERDANLAAPATLGSLKFTRTPIL